MSKEMLYWHLSKCRLSELTVTDNPHVYKSNNKLHLLKYDFHYPTSISSDKFERKAIAVKKFPRKIFEKSVQLIYQN